MVKVMMVEVRVVMVEVVVAVVLVERWYGARKMYTKMGQ